MTENSPGWWSRVAGAAARPARRPDRINPDMVGEGVAGTRATAVAAGAARRAEADGTVPRSVHAAAAWSWRVLVMAAAFAVVGYVIVTFKTVVVAFLVAVLLAVLLDPVAMRLRRYLRAPRSLAALATIAVTIAAVVGLLVLAGRSILGGFTDLAAQANAGVRELVTWLTQGPLGIDEAQVDAALEEVQSQIGANSGVFVSGVLSATSTITQALAGAVIAVFCLFFFLREGRRIWQWFVRLAPVRARDRINEAGIRGWVTLGAYARTQILVAFVDAVGIGLGAAILGLPLVLPLSILVFLGSFIPIVGAFVTGSVAVLVALVDQGAVTALLMLGVVLAVQQLEGNVLQPWLMGNAVSLHPVAVLLAVASGTAIAGILGALFAVPIAAVINTVVLYLHGHDKYPRLATDWHRPGGPPGIIFGAIRDSYAHVSEDDDDEDQAAPSAPTADDDLDEAPEGQELDDDGPDGVADRPGPRARDAELPGDPA